MSSRVTLAAPVQTPRSPETEFQRFKKPNPQPRREPDEPHSPSSSALSLVPGPAAVPDEESAARPLSAAWTASFLALLSSLKKVSAVGAKKAYARIKKDSRNKIRKGAMLDYEAK